MEVSKILWASKQTGKVFGGLLWTVHSPRARPVPSLSVSPLCAPRGSLRPVATHLRHPWTSRTPPGHQLLPAWGCVPGQGVLSRPVRTRVPRFQRHSVLPLPTPPNLPPYLDIVIETTFRRLQVKLPEDKLHPVPLGYCDHSGPLKIVRVRLGEQRGCHLPVEPLRGRDGASNPVEQDRQQEV